MTGEGGGRDEPQNPCGGVESAAAAPLCCCCWPRDMKIGFKSICCKAPPGLKVGLKTDQG